MRHGQALAEHVRPPAGGQKWLALAALAVLSIALVGPSLVQRQQRSSDKQAIETCLLPCGISLLQGRRAQVWHADSTPCCTMRHQLGIGSLGHAPWSQAHL